MHWLQREAPEALTQRSLRLLHPWHAREARPEGVVPAVELMTWPLLEERIDA